MPRVKVCEVSQSGADRILFSTPPILDPHSSVFAVEIVALYWSLLINRPILRNP